MNIAERAYLAGILDGEGSVTLTHAGTSATPRPQIEVANTSPKLIDWLRDHIGGHTTSYSQKQNPSWSTAFKWFLTNRDEVARVLTAVLPYLVIKQAQAMLVLEFLGTCKPVARGYSATEEHVLVGEKFVDRMRELNKRGGVRA